MGLTQSVAVSTKEAVLAVEEEPSPFSLGEEEESQGFYSWKAQLNKSLFPPSRWEF